MLRNAMDNMRCCTLFVGGVVSGVYATAIYLAAFCMEIGWIVDAEGNLPASSYILTAIYFSTLLISAILLIGIAKKKTRLLLIWLFFMGILFLPECGLVLYMSLRYWTLQNTFNFNGVTELTFYIFRAVINVLAFGPVFSNGGSHHKTDSELNGHSTGVGSYLNPGLIESDILMSYPSKRVIRSPSNLSHMSITQVPNFGNGNIPASPRDIFNARAAYWNTSKSEFDAASFVDFINNRPRPGSELGGALSRSHNEIPTTVFSVEGGWDKGEPMGYATQSLERPKFRNQPFGRRSRSLEDVSRTIQVPADMTLERMAEQPFQYLNRPGGVYRDESDTSDTQSIRDIAL